MTSISWEYLDKIMFFTGFGDKWRAWIRDMFKNARSSILMNGNSFDEFLLFIGFRYGDPISHFPFIIAMEDIHVEMKDSVTNGIFRGVYLGSYDLHISHLFYADDVLFLGEWDERNVHNLIRILTSFYMVSGLKINLFKIRSWSGL